MFSVPILRLAAAKMEECLKKGGEGRKFANALESLEYSGDLAKQLFAFSSKMEQVFKRLQELRSKKGTDPKLFQKHFNIIEDKMAWYAKAEASFFQWCISNWVWGWRFKSIPKD